MSLMTKAEIAEHIRLSIRQIERLLKEGMPFIPVGKRLKMYRVESVENWLLSRESCLSVKTKKVTGTSSFASSDNAYTNACRLTRQKKMQKTSKPKPDSLLSLVPTQQTQP